MSGFVLASDRLIPYQKARRPLITRLAARMEPAARRAFLAAVRSIQSQIDLDGLEAALRTGEMTRTEAALLLDRLPEALRERLRPVIGAALGVGAEGGREALRGTPAFAVEFARTNPSAVAWANQHAARLVTEVSESTRVGIRALVTTSQAEGRPVRWLARELREVVGLRASQVSAVDAFRLRLAAQGVDDVKLERRVNRYADAQLRRRAVTISRTETLTATHEGQQRLWDAAADQGLLDRDATQRVWIVTPDDRLDEEVCEPMDEQTVGLEEPFTTGIGTTVMLPPAHVNCRCTVGLEFAS